MFLAASVNSYSSFDLPAWLSQACGVGRSTVKQRVRKASHKYQKFFDWSRGKEKILALTGVASFSSNAWPSRQSFSTIHFGRDRRNLLFAGRCGNTRGREDPMCDTQPKNTCFFSVSSADGVTTEAPRRVQRRGQERGS